MNENELKKLKESANAETNEIMEALKKDAPGVYETVATAAGLTGGGAISLVTLSSIGTVTGLSAAGITSGLATAGAVVGGGMVAGIGVLAAPIAALGIGGYAIAKKRKNAKQLAALNQAITRLYNIQERLQSNAEYFKDELAGLKVMRELIESKMKKKGKK